MRSTRVSAATIAVRAASICIYSRRLFFPFLFLFFSSPFSFLPRALLVVSQPSLDPETAGNTLVSAAAANNAKEIFRNDKYSKFDLSIPTTWRAEVVCPASDRDVQKYSEQSFQIIRETPEMYNKVTKPFIDGISAKAIEWVYNILDGKKESENVIASHKDYMIVKDYKWSDEAKVTAMHVLGMPMEKGELKSIRDLRGKHIPASEDMMQRFSNSR